MLCLFVCIHSAPAQITTAEVDSLVENAMKEFNVAGVSVAIVKDGRIMVCKGYGVKNVETGGAVDSHTNFAIASNTKAFTAAALAILVEEGKLKWSDKVVDHIPEFRMYDPWVTAHFTIVDLMTHRSGLGLGAGDLTIFPAGSDFTIDDIVRIFQHFEPVSEFRTKYDYDNLLYIVAGEVIKRASGMRWEDFVQKRILDKIGMDNSFSSIALMHDRKSLATPHYTENGMLVPTGHDVFDPEKINGAMGSILSNAHDLCQWLLLQLNHGTYGKEGKKQLFSERNHQYMWRIHTVLGADPDPRYNSHFAGYGLGWRLSDMQGVMSVSHTGGLTGMLSKIQLIPDLNLGIAVLTNSWIGGAFLFRAVTQTITDRFLGLDRFDWTARNREIMQQRFGSADSVVAAVWRQVDAVQDAEITPELFTGTYEDPWFGRVKITQKDGGLYFQSARSPRLQGPMYFYKANTFAVKWEYRDMEADAFVMFRLGHEGRAAGFIMEGISPAIDFSFDFQDLEFSRRGGIKR